MIRVAIVGAGQIGRKHAACYHANPHTEVVAFCDMAKEVAEAAAEPYGCAAFTSVADMLGSGVGIDAAGVCTAGADNGSHHYAPTMELLRTGIPVLGEKPISNDIDEAREMVALAQEKGLRYGINLNHRFTPAAIRAKQWLEDGRLGALNLINIRIWNENKQESSPYYHLRAMHPHTLDIMRYYCGDVKQVQAFFKKGLGRNTWSNSQINLLFESGVIGHLTGSYDGGGPGSPWGLETWEVVGSKARFIVQDACEKLIFSPRHTWETEEYSCLGGMRSFDETFQSRINAWVEDLIKETPPDEIDGKAEDALKAQVVVEAIIESWNTGEVVAL